MGLAASPAAVIADARWRRCCCASAPRAARKTGRAWTNGWAIAGLPRPAGRLIWMHGASVGESLAALPLIEKLQAARPHVLVTSGTVTSAAMMASACRRARIHQYVPLDTPGAVARFLDHWRPDAGLFVESDLWPNLILAARARGMKLALVNARISAAFGASAGRGRRAPCAACCRPSTWCWPRMKRSPSASAGWARRNVQVVGSLKADAPPLAVRRRRAGRHAQRDRRPPGAAGGPDPSRRR